MTLLCIYVLLNQHENGKLIRISGKYTSCERKNSENICISRLTRNTSIHNYNHGLNLKALPISSLSFPSLTFELNMLLFCISDSLTCIIVKLHYLIIILFGLQGNLFSQEYNVGHKVLSLTDTERVNRTIPVELYYPADISGNNVPLSSCRSARYPVLCFAHGYLMSWESYEYIRTAVVQEGYIIAFPKTAGELFPSHASLAKDISFILKKISEYGNDT